MGGRVGEYLRQNVLGLVAIFIALTAGAYAVQKAPKNSVVSKSIKDGQVKTGDIGDGQVTTADIGDGAVTSPKLADGSVAEAKLGFNPVTQPELNALATPGTINAGGNPVDWTALKGVPTGFADGTDANSGGTVTSVASGAGLTGGPITGAGTLALTPCANGELLKSTGSGYACATDLDTNSGGDITGVTAGSGLSGGGTSGAVTLSLPACPTGQIVRTVAVGNWGCSANLWGGEATASGSTNPAVTGIEVLFLGGYSSPTAIVNLAGGVDGQRVTLLAAGTNATISDSGNFFLTANWTPNTDDTLTLINDGDLWYEVARSSN